MHHGGQTGVPGQLPTGPPELPEDHDTQVASSVRGLWTRRASGDSDRGAGLGSVGRAAVLGLGQTQCGSTAAL